MPLNSLSIGCEKAELEMKSEKVVINDSLLAIKEVSLQVLLAHSIHAFAYINSDELELITQ